MAGAITSVTHVTDPLVKLLMLISMVLTKCLPKYQQTKMMF